MARESQARRSAQEETLYKGYRIIDMDTHVGPSIEVLEKHCEPSFRPRLAEFAPYRRVRDIGTGGRKVEGSVITVAPVPYNRFAGAAPKPEDTQAKAGGKSAIEGRTKPQQRAQPQDEVQQENARGRVEDMDREGRDIDFIFPADWAATITALDVKLAEGLWRAYHRYLGEYTSVAPDRLKACLQVPGSDPEWAVAEIKRYAKERWVAAVWVQLREGLPVDHPDLDPIWQTMGEYDLPLVHHSFFYEPPYFPGYRDIWGNTVVARAAAHPWGAARLFAYVIVSGMLDRFPNLRVAASEVGHGWLPNWLIRVGFNKEYLQGATPKIKYTPLEYAQMGRVKCAAEPFEGPAMTKATIDLLGENCLMHQSDYPHGQTWFPDTAKEVIEWPIWAQLGKDALRKHMADNAASFLRLI